jgi:hypothetical protein
MEGRLARSREERKEIKKARVVFVVVGVNVGVGVGVLVLVVLFTIPRTLRCVCLWYQAITGAV